MKTPYDRLVKIYTNWSGNLTKMALTPVYGNNPLNIQKANGLGTWYVALGMTGPYKVCTNDESRLTLTYFMARSTLIPNAFI